jgi:hypothetical protein
MYGTSRLMIWAMVSRLRVWDMLILHFFKCMKRDNCHGMGWLE